MDKDILNYLDKVGQQLQGASVKGFETYVHGVFVKSLMYGISSIIVITICIIIWKLGMNYNPHQKRKEKESRGEDVYSSDYNGVKFAFIFFPIIGMVIAFGVLISSVIGIFAPDYVAIKEIVRGISNK